MYRLRSAVNFSVIPWLCITTTGTCFIQKIYAPSSSLMKQVPVITTQCSTEINTYSRLKIINSFQSSLNMLNLKCICDYILLYIVLIYVGWNLCTYVSSEYVNLHRCFVCTCSHIHVFFFFSSAEYSILSVVTLRACPFCTAKSKSYIQLKTE